MHPHLVVASVLTVRLLCAGLLGAAVGFERQWRQRGAGLHTSSLVAIGAALFSMLGPAVGGDTDTRTIANIVTGVGFLAGGVILRQGTTITGLNTAATIWSTAAVGAFAGLGYVLEASIGAAAIIGFNVVLQPVVTAIDGRVALHAEEFGEKRYRIRVECTHNAESAVRAAMTDFVRSEKSVNLRSLSTESSDQEETIETIVLLNRRNDELIERFVASLSQRDGVKEVNWNISDS